MKMIGERLTFLRKKKGLTQEELAKIFNMSRSTYAQYEVNRRKPDYNTLKMFADYYQVSIDWLLGLSDDPTPPTLPTRKSPAGDADKEALLLFGRISRLSKAGKEQILKALEWIEEIEAQERKIKSKEPEN